MPTVNFAKLNAHFNHVHVECLVFYTSTRSYLVINMHQSVHYSHFYRQDRISRSTNYRTMNESTRLLPTVTNDGGQQVVGYRTDLNDRLRQDIERLQCQFKVVLRSRENPDW